MPIDGRAAPLIACLLLLLASPARAAASSSEHDALHLLNRLAFGPTLEELRHVEAIGAQHYIDEQLDPETIPEPPELTQKLAALDTVALGPAQLFQQYGPPLPFLDTKPSPEQIKAARERSLIIIQQAMQARILRATLSHRQLQEVMVDFWYNHFNVFADKAPDHLWVGTYEMQAIRPYALGNFRDLLLATARHPAMLFYLDNAENSAPGSRGAGGRELGFNENYAREVMELHTLGVDGRYAQADVETLAQILTGWTINPASLRRGIGDAFVFAPGRHIFGPKTFLGRPIDASGEVEGQEALDMLARSPATARHIAYKLAQYFVADAPPASLVDRLAGEFLASEGNIRVVLKALFTSHEFRDTVGDKYKTPEQFVLSAVRAAGVQVQNPRPLIGAMARLGMPLYRCPTPDGYKNTADAWLNPDATTLRINFATAFARGNLPIANPPPAATAPVLISDPAPPLGNKDKPVDAVHLEEMLGAGLSARTRAAVAAAPAELRAALLLGSPDFMRR